MCGPFDQIYKLIMRTYNRIVSLFQARCRATELARSHWTHLRQYTLFARLHCAHLRQHAQFAFKSEAGSVDGAHA